VPGTVLITGITGFAGSHLAERFVTRGDDVHGMAHEDPPFPHLAAVADRVRVHRGNVLGTATLLAALDAHPEIRLVMASSADVYGAPDTGLVDESAPLRPANVYAATKVASEALVREFGDRRTVATTVLRPANQNGPRQHPGLAASAFAKQIAEAEAGMAEPVVKHGVLEARRDFVDVRDMADAYARTADLTDAGVAVYNVGSGVPVSVGEILEILVALARVPVRAELDPERVRSGTPTAFALDASRFRRRTGWAPRTALRTSLRDTLDYWRSQVKAEAGVGAPGRGATA
jgi:GDP-4-dehydro-6-deoxy-D-mannose reductase